ncbi:MAG: type IV conjugative transfer system protein TraL [Pseudomonadota bacterium]
MNLGEHRIFKHMSAPLRVVGLTIDELSIGVVGFSVFFFVSNKVIGFVLLALALGGVWLWKKSKKQAAGFSVVSFLNWYFGSRVAQIDASWLPSYERRWLA